MVQGILKPAAIFSAIDQKVQAMSPITGMWPNERVDSLTFEGDAWSVLKGVPSVEIDEHVGNQSIAHWPFNGRLAFTHVKFMQTDKDKVMTQSGAFEKHVTAAAESHKVYEENHILTNLKAGAHTDNLVTASDTWCDTGVLNGSGTVLDDITTSLNLLRSNADAGFSSFEGLPAATLVVPADCATAVNQIMNINNSNVSMSNYLMNQWNCKIVSHQDFTGSRLVTEYGLTTSLGNDALVFMHSDPTIMRNTATLYEFGGKEVPMVESERVMGVGQQYLTKRGYNLKVKPSESGGTTNFNIARIATIRS